MSTPLHLTITTPNLVLVDCRDVASVRAEDESGGFGVLPGHVDLLTVLGPSVLRWREANGQAHYCALRSGVLRVSEGAHVAVACRQGTVDDDLASLENRVRAMRAEEVDARRRAQVDEMRLHTRAVRQLMRYLQPNVGSSDLDALLGEGDLP